MLKLSEVSIPVYSQTYENLVTHLENYDGRSILIRPVETDLDAKILIDETDGKVYFEKVGTEEKVLMSNEINFLFIPTKLLDDDNKLIDLALLTSDKNSDNFELVEKSLKETITSNTHFRLCVSEELRIYAANVLYINEENKQGYLLSFGNKEFINIDDYIDVDINELPEMAFVGKDIFIPMETEKYSLCVEQFTANKNINFLFKRKYVETDEIKDYTIPLHQPGVGKKSNNFKEIVDGDYNVYVDEEKFEDHVIRHYVFPYNDEGMQDRLSLSTTVATHPVRIAMTLKDFIENTKEYSESIELKETVTKLINLLKV